MKLSHALLAALLVIPCTSAFAQWQWLDKDGRKVFSDRGPGADIPEKNILKRPGGLNSKTQPSAGAVDTQATQAAPAPALAASKAGADKTLEAKKKQSEEAEAAKRKSDEERAAKGRAENCLRAKNAKGVYEAEARISRTTSTGQREIMDDSARAAEMQRIQGIIDADCK